MKNARIGRYGHFSRAGGSRDLETQAARRTRRGRRRTSKPRVGPGMHPDPAAVNGPS